MSNVNKVNDHEILIKGLTILNTQLEAHLGFEKTLVDIVAPNKDLAYHEINWVLRDFESNMKAMMIGLNPLAKLDIKAILHFLRISKKELFSDTMEFYNSNILPHSTLLRPLNYFELSFPSIFTSRKDYLEAYKKWQKLPTDYRELIESIGPFGQYVDKDDVEPQLFYNYFKNKYPYLRQCFQVINESFSSINMTAEVSDTSTEELISKTQSFHLTEAISNDNLGQMIDHMIKQKYFRHNRRTDLIKVFQAEPIEEPIRWFGNAAELNRFLMKISQSIVEFRDDSQYARQPWKIAASIFCKETGEPFLAKPLRTASKAAVKPREFNECRKILLGLA